MSGELRVESIGLHHTACARGCICCECAAFASAALHSAAAASIGAEILRVPLGSSVLLSVVLALTHLSSWIIALIARLLLASGSIAAAAAAQLCSALRRRAQTATHEDRSAAGEAVDGR